MSNSAKSQRRILVTGGFGFIGGNICRELLKDEQNYVAIVDNFSKPQAPVVLFDHKRLVRYAIDVADERRMREVFAAVRPTHVFHLAAQTAVTRSIDDPDEDFWTNVVGTRMVLKFVKLYAPQAQVVFSSTNKVYGSMEHMKYHPLIERETSYEMEGVMKNGLSVRDWELDPITPYGVSKAAADLMVQDAMRTGGLKTVVLRQSCIYGPNQYGTFDQGWVSHLAHCVMKDEDVCITGNGKQVRDLLHVDDLVRLYISLLDPEVFRKAQGVHNVGGGIDNAASILEVVKHLAEIHGKDTRCVHMTQRHGDQLWFVANNSSISEATGWKPTVDWREGVRQCYEAYHGS